MSMGNIPRLKIAGFLLLGLFLVGGLALTVITLQNRTSIQQEAHGGRQGDDDDDRKIDKIARDEEPRKLNLRKIFERYKVCRKNNTPKKCWKNIEEILPPDLRDRLKITVTPAPTTVLPPDTPAPTQSSPAPTHSGGASNVTFAVNVCPHAIGSCGDNVAPGQGTLNPLNPTREVLLSIKNENNQEVGTFEGNVTYDASAKHFKGTINVSIITPGSYLVTVKMPGYLSALAPGIQRVQSASAQHALPLTYLVTGDINNDNAINIQDYHIFISCYSDFEESSAECTTSEKEASDLNDDGEVNFIDYNVFLRELSAQRGV